MLYGHGVHIKANSTMTHLRQGKEVAEHQVCVQVTVLHRQPDKNFFSACCEHVSVYVYICVHVYVNMCVMGPL